MTVVNFNTLIYLLYFIIAYKKNNLIVNLILFKILNNREHNFN